VVFAPFQHTVQRAPRYLWPREQVFQPLRVRFGVVLVLAFMGSPWPSTACRQVSASARDAGGHSTTIVERVAGG
jgi:hypothetical protein